MNKIIFQKFAKLTDMLCIKGGKWLLNLTKTQVFWQHWVPKSSDCDFIIAKLIICPEVKY